MFMKRKKILSWSLIIVIFLLCGGGGIGYAKVTGVCSNCHTMHNSQDGADITTGPNNFLLVGGCVGCHSHPTETQTYSLDTSTVPIVNTGIEPATYLAGGNFYWVADSGGNDDAKGHNVLGISAQDGNIPKSAGAPGDAYSGICGGTSCHETLAEAQTSNPELGGSGCEGCHLNVMHHADDGTGTKYVDTAPKGWYRFLSGHNTADGYGVKGIEDADLQATMSALDHNEYLGDPGDKTVNTSLTKYSVTAFCCGCHGNFHEQNAYAATGAGSQSPWLRHPSDFVIPNSGEYASMSTTYNPDVPVARPIGFTGWASGTPSDSLSLGTDMVMCLSCHRPHGSPYDDMLRWDYSTINAGGGSNTDGCFFCHTTKDD